MCSEGSRSKMDEYQTLHNDQKVKWMESCRELVKMRKTDPSKATRAYKELCDMLKTSQEALDKLPQDGECHTFIWSHKLSLKELSEMTETLKASIETVAEPDGGTVGVTSVSRDDPGAEGEGDDGYEARVKAEEA